MNNRPAATCWKAMRQRCLNPRNPSFHRYGERGITICQEWDSFDRFSADMGPRPKGATLERIDNDGNYEPGNVRWASRAEQARNRHDTRLVVFDGRTQTIAEWAREVGLDQGTLYRRLRAGWPVSRALSTPADARFQPVKNGRKRTLDVDKADFSGRPVYAERD